MTTRYVCDYCGHEGKVPGHEPAERIQCPMCGEPTSAESGIASISASRART